MTSTVDRRLGGEVSAMVPVVGGPAAASGRCPRRRVSLLLLAFAFTACGGGSDSSSTTSSVPTEGADRERAGRVVLTPGDLPGFRVQQSDADGDAAFSDAYRRCRDQPLVLLDDANPRLARSAGFASTNSRLRLSSFAILLREEGEARDVLAGIRRVFEGPCFDAALRDGLAEKFDGRDVAVRDFGLPPVTDDRIARRVMFTRVVERAQEAVHFDLTYLRQGRAVAGLVVAGFMVPFPTDQRVRLTNLIAGRLATESGSSPATSVAVPGPSTTLSPDKFPRVPNVVGMTLPRARAVMIEAGFIQIRATDGTARGRVPSLEDASWTVRFHSPAGGSPLPSLADIVLILDVTRPGERYTPDTSPCPRFVQC